MPRRSGSEQVSGCVAAGGGNDLNFVFKVMARSLQVLDTCVQMCRNPQNRKNQSGPCVKAVCWEHWGQWRLQNRSQGAVSQRHLAPHEPEPTTSGSGSPSLTQTQAEVSQWLKAAAQIQVETAPLSEPERLSAGHTAPSEPGGAREGGSTGV